ncbi:MAG: hypothetical protein PHY12_03605 [Eubacteriales bacterium]|nr:hypothetical protein [Eubacteriales bacterium]
MKKRMLCALLALVTALALLPLYAVADAGGDPQWITVPFTSPTSRGGVYEWDFPYGDAFFSGSAQDYQHALAQSSLGLAISAFRQKSDTLAGKDGAVRAFLSEAGFGELRSEQYDVETSIDTIATMIGQKKLPGGATLIALAVSGAGYENEWQSNLTLSTQRYDDESVFHDGFAEAASKVVERLTQYMTDYKLGSGCKLWIAGYSRAAAVSNLTAFAVSSFQLVDEGNLYAYTFATPRCVLERDLVPCPGLFNIVGAFDPVAGVPFADWGYDRFGDTRYLPAQEITPDYAARKAAVQPLYKQLTGLDYWNNPQANWLCVKVMQTLDDVMRGAGDYRDELQQTAVDILKLKGGLLGRLLGARRLLLSNGDGMGTINSAVFNTDTLFSTFAYELTRQRLGRSENLWNHGVSMAAELFHEHCPDVYVAWMFSQDDPDALFADQLAYHQVVLSGDFTATVTHDDGTPVSDPVTFSLGAARLISLPADAACTLTLTANRDTTLNGFVNEHMAHRLAVRLMGYAETPVAAGEMITLPVPAGIDNPADAYAPVSGGAALSLAYNTDTLGFRSGMPEMDTAYSGDRARFFLQHAFYWFLGLLALVLLLLALLMVKLVRRHKRKWRASARTSKLQP